MLKYRIIYELLRKHILEGVYREGDYLPSENELCRLHNITRPTVRHALSKLTNDGLIHQQQGKGSIVHHIPQDIGILSVSGTTSAIGRKILKTHILRGPTIIQWPEKFIFDLSTTEMESGCIYMERIRLVNELPLFYDISYIANVNLTRFCSRTFENKSLFEILRKNYSIEIKGGVQRLKAIAAEGKIIDLLKVKKGKPVLYLERKLETSRANFYIYSSLYCNTETHALYGAF
ncbi:MAG: GntR family transcriptional regulator [Bacteroidales bacterium]|jgi:GntR family transcriptional regulator/GntR family frlABCD operon transcriptional regulator